MITHFKDGKRLPLRYAWQIMLGAQRAFLQEGELCFWAGAKPSA
jgi:hypothetical protein